MRDTISASILNTEIAVTLEIFEKSPISWENDLFIRVNKSKFGMHSYCIYLKDKIPYQENPLTGKEVDDFIFFLNKALESEGFSVIKLGSNSLTLVTSPDGRCGIAVEDRKWLVPQEAKDQLINYSNQ